jgi:hypothetical protein
MHESLVVRSADDTRVPPAPFYLLMAREREPDDEAGGSGLLEFVAERVQGKLVHVVALEPRGAVAVAPMTYEQAMLRRPPVAPIDVPAPPAPMAGARAMGEPSAGGGVLVLLAGLGALGLGYAFQRWR